MASSLLLCVSWKSELGKKMYFCYMVMIYVILD